jgi:hypothetical protein
MKFANSLEIMMAIVICALYFVFLPESIAVRTLVQSIGFMIGWSILGNPRGKLVMLMILSVILSLLLISFAG